MSCASGELLLVPENNLEKLEISHQAVSIAAAGLQGEQLEPEI